MVSDIDDCIVPCAFAVHIPDACSIGLAGAVTQQPNQFDVRMLLQPRPDGFGFMDFVVIADIIGSAIIPLKSLIQPIQQLSRQ
jgi:hypothetical protein